MRLDLEPLGYAGLVEGVMAALQGHLCFVVLQVAAEPLLLLFRLCINIIKRFKVVATNEALVVLEHLLLAFFYVLEARLDDLR